MSFKVFFQWARNNLVEPRTFQSLGKRSQFQVRYNQDSNEMEITNSKGNVWHFRTTHLQRIFERYFALPHAQRHRAVYYTDPEWVETPNRIFAPAVPAIIRYWAES